jgi:phosphoribosyl 1,2-cyclic phosphodiesterase
MSLFTTSLNSGSNGNCYYIANTSEAVIIDVGISCREVEKRLSRLSLDMAKVKAIFVSHEHSDHINGIKVLSKKYQLPVYISKLTHQASGLFIPDDRVKQLSAYKPIQVGGLQITAFPKFHDCADPHSFIVSGNGVNIGVFTDIGLACDHVIQNFKMCHAAFLETNYDEKMLDEGHYPPHLKHRIRSNHGHLSNDQALDLFIKHKPVNMSHVFLSHLSKENNNPKLVHQLFTEKSGSTNVIVASRDNEIPVFEITATTTSKIKRQTKSQSNCVQTSLF